MDKIDQMIACLHGHAPEIPFDRDALAEDRPGDRWGAVELRGAAGAVWADGRLIDQGFLVELWLCVDDLDSEWLEDIQEALAEYGETEDIGYGLAERVYLPDIDRTLWRWTVTIYGGLTVEEPEEETETETETEPGGE